MVGGGLCRGDTALSREQTPSGCPSVPLTGLGPREWAHLVFLEGCLCSAREAARGPWGGCSMPRRRPDTLLLGDSGETPGTGESWELATRRRVTGLQAGLLRQGVLTVTQKCAVLQ